MAAQTFQEALSAEFKSETDPVVLTYAQGFSSFHLLDMAAWMEEAEASTLKGQPASELQTVDKIAMTALGVCDARARSASESGPEWSALVGRIEAFLDRVDRARNVARAQAARAQLVAGRYPGAPKGR